MVIKSNIVGSFGVIDIILIMKKQVFLFVITCCFLGCNSNNTQKNTVTKVTVNDETEFFEIDVRSALKISEELVIPYSSFVENIEYVPLQTTSLSLINEGKHGIISDISKKLIIADMNVFDRNTGHFLFKLGTRGQGPEEYTYVVDVEIDDEREEIYVLNAEPSKILTYSFDNKFKYTVGALGSEIFYAMGNGNLLLSRPGSIRNGYYDYCVVNVDSKETVFKHISSLVKKSGDFSKCKGIMKAGSKEEPYFIVTGKNQFWKYNEKWCYYEYLTDSVFVINNRFEPVSRGYLDMDDLKITEEQWKVGFFKQNFFTWVIKSISETTENITIDIFSGNIVQKIFNNYLITYSKSDKKIKSVLNPIYEDDLAQGVAKSFLLKISNENSKYYYISPDEMNAEIEKKGAKSFSTGKAKEFKEIANRMKEDDNNVTCILKLR